MATRQYIGARYVMKIYENSQTAGSAEWEANTSYEPLTMVTYQNSSYLSKKAVPATVGNPASNGDYWVVTGAYNGQIASLQSQIDDMKDGNVSGSLQSQINDADSLISALTTNITNANIINVLDYGATGDGVTDDYNAIMTAINAIDSTHRIVYFPAGTYLISGTIAFNGIDNITFVGVSNASVIKASGTAPIITFETAHYINIIGMTLDRATAGSGNGIMYINDYWSRFHYFNNLTIKNQTNGIYAKDSRIASSFIDNCKFINNTNGVSLVMNNDVFFTNCDFSSNSNHGLSVGGSTTLPSDGGVWCVNCMSYNNAIGLALNGTAAHKVCNFNWKGGIVDNSQGSYASVVISNAEGVDIDTKISWGNGVGAIINDSSRVRLAGEINDTSLHGVQFIGTCKYIDIDCDISSVGSGTPNTYHGIEGTYATVDELFIKGIIANRSDKVTINTGIALGSGCSNVTFIGGLYNLTNAYTDSGTNNAIFNGKTLNGQNISTTP